MNRPDKLILNPHPLPQMLISKATDSYKVADFGW